MVTTTCSWCHAANPSTAEVCSNCGHDAQQARLDCRCYRCVPGTLNEEDLDPMLSYSHDNSIIEER